MQTKNWLILLIVISFVVTSCKKEEEIYWPISYVGEEVHPFLFDIGSVWLYKNPVSKEIDNVEIIDFAFDRYIPGGKLNGELQFYRISYVSDVFGEYKEYACLDIISRAIHFGGILFIASGNEGDECENARIDTIYSSFYVNGIAYEDVVKMEIEADEWLDIEMNLYWADSIGVVKKEIIENDQIIETWNLQSYDVVLYKPQ